MAKSIKQIQTEANITCEKIKQHLSQIESEYNRVADVAHNAKEILDNLDADFERRTGLDEIDIPFLFFATAMQCARIFLLNKLTEIDKAGNGNKTEDAIHKFQKKILKRFDDGKRLMPTKYHAPLNQIIFSRGVPYDATAYGSEEVKSLRIFKGANHRFTTVGHDPVLGLIFGTANILTNTITCVKAPIMTTFHVTYDAEIKNPTITSIASTLKTFDHAVERCKDDKKSVVAALIKQILHIGTDLYTPNGIQLPSANLVLSNKNVEKLTGYISTGDVFKFGTSAGLSIFINFLVGAVHNLMYDETKYDNRTLYNVKTRKIIIYSNTIASASNLIWVGGNMLAGNEGTIKDLDIGGLIVTIHRLLTDTKFIRQVKEEFIKNEIYDKITGEEYDFMKGDF